MFQTSARGYVEAHLIQFCAKTRQDSFPDDCANHKATCVSPRQMVAIELGLCLSSGPCTAKQAASALNLSPGHIFTPRWHLGRLFHVCRKQVGLTADEEWGLTGRGVNKPHRRTKGCIIFAHNKPNTANLTYEDGYWFSCGISMEMLWYTQIPIRLSASWRLLICGLFF